MCTIEAEVAEIVYKSDFILLETWMCAYRVQPLRYELSDSLLCMANVDGLSFVDPSVLIVNSLVVTIFSLVMSVIGSRRAVAVSLEVDDFRFGSF